MSHLPFRAVGLGLATVAVVHWILVETVPSRFSAMADPRRTA